MGKWWFSGDFMYGGPRIPTINSIFRIVAKIQVEYFLNNTIIENII